MGKSAIIICAIIFVCQVVTIFGDETLAKRHQSNQYLRQYEPNQVYNPYQGWGQWLSWWGNYWFQVQRYWSKYWSQWVPQWYNNANVWYQVNSWLPWILWLTSFNPYRYIYPSRLFRF